MPETVREHYAALARKAGECIACGACSKRCPFGVDAVENMRRAEETFRTAGAHFVLNDLSQLPELIRMIG